MMKVEIEAPFKISKPSQEVVEEKGGSLEEYNLGITQVDVYFKLDDGEADKVVHAEIEVRKPGNTIFASDKDKDFMKAFNSAFQEIKRQVIKQKERLKRY
jgi:ribosomal subunit interface protein